MPKSGPGRKRDQGMFQRPPPRNEKEACCMTLVLSCRLPCTIADPSDVAVPSSREATDTVTSSQQLTAQCKEPWWSLGRNDQNVKLIKLN